MSQQVIGHHHTFPHGVDMSEEIKEVCGKCERLEGKIEDLNVDNALLDVELVDLKKHFREQTERISALEKRYERERELVSDALCVMMSRELSGLTEWQEKLALYRTTNRLENEQYFKNKTEKEAT